MFTWILPATIALLLMVNFLLGLRRGLLRSGVRLALLLLTVPLAIMITRAIAAATGGTISPLVVSMLEASDVEVTTLISGATAAMDALVTMLIAVVSFTSVYLFLGLLTKLADKPLALLLEKKLKPDISSRLGGALLGVACGSVLSVAILCPITGMLPTINGALALTGGQEDNDPIVAEVQAFTESPWCRAVNIMGGDLIISAVTTTEYKDTRVNLRTEASAVTDLADGFLLLTKQPADQWGDTEKHHINNAAVSFDESVITADLAAVLLSDMGSAWGYGGQFMGAPVPSMGEILDPSMITLFQAVSDSTRASVRQNVHTVADVLGAMIDHGVLAQPQASASTAEKATPSPLSAFSNAAFTADVVDALYRDEQLRVLIPEVINLSVRAMAQALGVPETTDAIYTTVMQECADAFNATRAQSDVAHMVLFGDELYDILSRNGMGLSPSVATALAMGMVADYASTAEITAADVQTWFTAYAASATPSPEQISSDLPATPGFDSEQPLLIPLGADFTDKTVLPGAEAAAAYIMTTEQAPAPYQYLVARNLHTDREIFAVSMSDGSIIGLDASGNPLDLDSLGLGSLAALAGGEFAALDCGPDWEITVKPTRIGAEHLSTLGTVLLAALSPLPDGYTPSEDDTPLYPVHLQNAQNSATPVLGIISLHTALNGAANHELVRGLYSEGTCITLDTPDHFVTALPCLNDMLVGDVLTVCETMTPEAAQTVGSAVSAFALLLSSGSSSEQPMEDLFGAAGSQVLSSLLDSQTALTGNSSAAVNTLLAGVSYIGGDIVALRSTLEKDSVSVSAVATQMLSAADALSALAQATDAASCIDAIEDMLATLTPDAARAISDTISPSMLRGMGLPDRMVATFTPVIHSTLNTMATAKENGMTDEQYRREAKALSTLFSTATQLSGNNSENLFGEGGALDTDADTLLDAILSSNIVSGAIIEMVGGTGGAYFTISNTDPFLQEILSESDRDALENAIAAVEATLPTLPDSNGELWTPINNQVTRQDTARRLIAIAALFGLEYTTEYANIGS